MLQRVFTFAMKKLEEVEENEKRVPQMQVPMGQQKQKDKGHVSKLPSKGSHKKRLERQV